MRRDADQCRFERIREYGYNLITIWECDFDKELKANDEMKKYIKSLSHLGENKLEPRDAYFGGRTNAIKLYHDCAEGEKIKYVDICSLYPYVLKYFPMPVGVPKVLIGADLNGRTVHNINGIIKCKVLPPKSLFHPVLPLKMHNRLLFPLCYTCALKKCKNSCRHSDKERSFDGTYVANELRLAVDKGYAILKIFEAWEYQMLQYNKETGENGLFSEYINFFLKLKTEASGWPEWANSEEKKQKYIEDYLRDEGILLEYDKIVYNPGLRALAKALLNFLYGKFGERGDKTKKIICNTRAQVINLMTNTNIEVKSMVDLSNDSAMFTYKNLKEADMDAPYNNVVIAAFVTAHGRTVLYKYLDILQKFVLYFDTDSVIYLERYNTPKITIGDLLGDMTNELASYGPNAYIQTFVSGGPKNYAFKIKDCEEEDEKYVCKVKGIRLNYLNSQRINFETIKELLLSNEREKNEEIVVKTNMILREANSIVYTITGKMYKYKINVTKRRRLNDRPMDTLPFGHI